MPLNLNDTKILKSPLNILSTMNYNVNLMSKNKKTETTIKALSEATSIKRKIIAINNPSMAKRQNSIHDLPDLKNVNQKKTRTAIINDNLIKLNINRKADNFHSGKKRSVEIKAIENSNKVQEEEMLDSKINRKLRNSNEITIPSILMREAHTSKDEISEMPFQILAVVEYSQKNIWFVSDKGSDENNCQIESTPCRNLQTVLVRASDNADIYSTSDTLSLDLANDTFWYKMSLWGEPYTAFCCLIKSSLSYTLRSITGTETDIFCSGEQKLKNKRVSAYPFLVNTKRSKFKY